MSHRPDAPRDRSDHLIRPDHAGWAGIEEVRLDDGHATVMVEHQADGHGATRTGFVLNRVQSIDAVTALVAVATLASQTLALPADSSTLDVGLIGLTGLAFVLAVGWLRRSRYPRTPSNDNRDRIRDPP